MADIKKTRKHAAKRAAKARKDAAKRSAKARKRAKVTAKTTQAAQTGNDIARLLFKHLEAVVIGQLGPEPLGDREQILAVIAGRHQGRAEADDPAGLIGKGRDDRLGDVRRNARHARLRGDRDDRCGIGAGARHAAQC